MASPPIAVTYPDGRVKTLPANTAKILITLGKARLVEDVTPPKKKRTYRRRDLTAEG